MSMEKRKTGFRLRLILFMALVLSLCPTQGINVRAASGTAYFPRIRETGTITGDETEAESPTSEAETERPQPETSVPDAIQSETQTETTQPEPVQPGKTAADPGKIANIVAESANGGLSSDNRVARLQKKYKQRKNQEKILLAGGSSIRRWDSAASRFAPLKTVNMGIGGSTTKDWLKWYKKLIVDYHPKEVVLYVGGNDFHSNKVKGKTVAKQCQKLLTCLKKELPGTKIYYVAVYPSLARRPYQKQINVYNKKMKSFCKSRKNIYYIDMSSSFYKNGKLQKNLFVSDGLHLNAKGYRLWNQAIVKKVKAGAKK